MWVAILSLGFILVVGIASRLPGFKGWAGEQAVNLGIKLFLDDRYHLVKNVTLPVGDGTTQIDHVIVSRYGIFVIETKNMRGGIYGGQHDKQWTQALGGKKFRFQNPLRQNYKHTMALAEILGVPHETLISVIMFIGDAKLKTREKMPDNVMDRGLCRFVKSHREELLTDDQVARTLSVIEERRLAPSFATHRQHVKHVKGIVERKQTPPPHPASSAPTPPPLPSSPTVEPPVAEPTQAAPMCPKCGKEMVRRVAKRGANTGNAFWGCSGYPTCRTTSPIKA